MGCCGSANSRKQPLLDGSWDDAYIDNLPTKCCSILGCCGCLQPMLVNAIIGARTQPKRQALPETPAALQIPFKEVDIASTDGIRLSAWEMVNANSDKLIVFNHPLLCTRWGSTEGFEGVTATFMPMYKILFDAGYSILTYDQRGQGESDGNIGDKAKGPKECPAGVGAVEWQDFAGVMNYVNSHELFGKCKIALYSQCMGASAVFMAWDKTPEVFDLDRVKCQFANQPVISYNMVARITTKNLGKDIAAEIDDAMEEKVGFRGVNPIPLMKQVKVPVLFAQVRNDYYTNSVLYEENSVNDIVKIKDACPTAEKDVIWIGTKEKNPFGSDMRFDAYNYFNNHPEEVLAFFDKYMKD